MYESEVSKEGLMWVYLEYVRDAGSIPGSGRSAGGGHGNPALENLENPMDSGAWQATVHRVA